MLATVRLIVTSLSASGPDDQRIVHLGCSPVGLPPGPSMYFFDMPKPAFDAAGLSIDALITATFTVTEDVE